MHLKVTVTNDGALVADYSLDDSAVRMAPHPFAEGGQRLAYLGFGQENVCENLVLKTTRYSQIGDLEDGSDEFLRMAEAQAVSDYFANEFNLVKPSRAKEIVQLNPTIVKVSMETDRTLPILVRVCLRCMPHIQPKSRVFEALFHSINVVLILLSLHSFLTPKER